MKIKLNIIAFFALILIGVVSCDEKWVDVAVNDDPNNPKEVTMDLLLPSSHAGMAYIMGGNASFYSSIFMQQLSGGEGQMSDADKYFVVGTTTNRMWNLSYAGWLTDLKIVMEKADELEAPHYKGVAQVSTALALGMLTDLFGDIPYSDALKGAENLKPKYDTQEKIYETIFTLLNDGVTNLKLDANNRPVGNDDLIYAGDAKKWITAANSLKARYMLHKSKLPGFKYSDVLTVLNGDVFKSNADELQFDFGAGANENAPIYRMHQDRVNYLTNGAKYVDALIATGDPRLPKVSTPNSKGVQIGGKPGLGENGVSLAGGELYGANNAPIEFMTYCEVEFMKAECYLPTDKVKAAEAYNKAVKASLANMGVSNAKWEIANASETNASITLEKIINAKWLALYNQIEVWTDWRRTGYPTLALSSNNVITEIPRRMPYPDHEITYNTANVPPIPSTSSMTKRMWWDVK